MCFYPHLNQHCPILICDPAMNLTANQPLDSLIIHYHINMQMYTGFCVVRDCVAKWDWIINTTFRSKHWASCSVEWINYAETGNILFVGVDQEVVKQLGENVLKHLVQAKPFFFFFFSCTKQDLGHVIACDTSRQLNSIHSKTWETKDVQLQSRKLNATQHAFQPQ